MTLGVRGLVYDRANNAVFLIRHTYMPGWQLPGGGVETGETMLEALEREVREEGNIIFTAPPQLKSIHLNRQASRRDHVAFYLIEGFEQSTPEAARLRNRRGGFLPARCTARCDDTCHTPAHCRSARRYAGDALLVIRPPS